MKMAKKLTKRQRDKVRDEMWNMLWQARGGWNPSDIDTDGHLGIEMGLDEWFKWIEALRFRYARHPENQSCFLPDCLERFESFEKSHEYILEMIEMQAYYEEQDAAKKST
jgi:hypothetical protein